MAKQLPLCMQDRREYRVPYGEPVLHGRDYLDPRWGRRSMCLCRGRSMPGILDRRRGLQQVVRHVMEADVTKPVQGVFLGMAVMGGVWAISALSLSRLWDAVATGVFMLLYASGLMYWNNRKTKES